MSSPVKGYEFSTTTSGTERERGFVGIVSFQSDPFFINFIYFRMKRDYCGNIISKFILFKMKFLKMYMMKKVIKQE